ncbi:MAG: hypothetical protein PHI84_22115 [Kiritimatiellae bacterium]|nr:hypothetical protein [Kiritimatiellia bacterium]
MAKPKLERNGDSEGQEMDQESTVMSETMQSPVVQDSPAPATESPTKWVVFRSHDKELALFQKAGFMDKSHGMVTYNPSVGVQFVDFYLRVQDIPKHADTIKWLRGHPSNGISFAEVPDLSNIVELPTIAQMKQMSIVELKELCAKNKVKVTDNASMDTIILALVENVK